MRSKDELNGVNGTEKIEDAVLGDVAGGMSDSEYKRGEAVSFYDIKENQHTNTLSREVRTGRVLLMIDGIYKILSDGVVYDVKAGYIIGPA